MSELEIGDLVKVIGKRGVFRVTGYAKDGSVQVFGGPRQQLRSFRPEAVRKARRSEVTNQRIAQ